MTKERILELMIYFQTSKKTTEYLISSENFDGDKKTTAKIALDIFNDTLECLEMIMVGNGETSDNVEVNNGDASGQQS